MDELPTYDSALKRFLRPDDAGDAGAGGGGAQVEERAIGFLLQVCGAPEALAGGRKTAGEALAGALMLPLSPTRLWVLGVAEATARAGSADTRSLEASLRTKDLWTARLEHGHTLLEISGTEAGALLARGCAIDFDLMEVGATVRTSYAEVGVVITRTATGYLLLAPPFLLRPYLRIHGGMRC